MPVLDVSREAPHFRAVSMLGSRGPVPVEILSWHLDEIGVKSADVIGGEVGAALIARNMTAIAASAHLQVIVMQHRLWRRQ